MSTKIQNFPTFPFLYRSEFPPPGNCELPRKWNGERPVYCQTNKHCRDRVGSKSKCDRAR